MASCGEFWMYCEPLDLDTFIKWKMGELKLRLKSISFASPHKPVKCDGDNSDKHFICHDWGCAHCKFKRGYDMNKGSRKPDVRWKDIRKIAVDKGLI